MADTTRITVLQPTIPTRRSKPCIAFPKGLSHILRLAARFDFTRVVAKRSVPSADIDDIANTPAKFQWLVNLALAQSKMCSEMPLRFKYRPHKGRRIRQTPFRRSIVACQQTNISLKKLRSENRARFVSGSAQIYSKLHGPRRTIRDLYRQSLTRELLLSHCYIGWLVLPHIPSNRGQFFADLKILLSLADHPATRRCQPPKLLQSR